MPHDRTTIWYLISALPVGGAEQTLLALTETLPRSEYDVTIWTIKDEGPLRASIPDHVRYRSLDAAGKWDLRKPIQFVRNVRSEQPDIVQSFLFFDNVLARFVSLVPSNPTIITGVRYVPIERPLHREFTDRLTVNLADVIISNSISGAKYVVELGAYPDSVRVIHNGRNLDAYASGVATNGLYAELGLNPEKPVVGTVGRLLERKGHLDLVKAWPTVLESHPDAQLLLVGDGPARPLLERQQERLGIKDSVTVPGTRDDVPELLDAMDVFAFPSHAEGHPGALLEAMAAGLPIVATPVNGNSELVSDGESGIFVPPRKPALLAHEIVRLLSNPELADSLGNEASNVARAEFSLDRMVNEFESLYQEFNG